MVLTPIWTLKVILGQGIDVDWNIIYDFVYVCFL